ncbi:MAG: serine hydroxymethyltransferase [Candidatus Liptonbacteria bacterium]|nr:serine hydroxymethyltransferase [Candidatus Liptonbacteria bacterium]
MKDKAIEKLIKAETKRQNETINLIPSENYVSKDVLEALGSVLTNKYAEGYPKKRYYGGNEFIDEIENAAKARSLQAFGLKDADWGVNVQPYSGSPANLAILAALVPLGEKIMGLQLDMGGHLTHGHKVSFTSKAWKSVPYVLNKKTEELDYEAIGKFARQEKPKLIITGYTAYPKVIDFKKFREIADQAGAYLMVDMSHFAGLVAGGVYPTPFKYADVVVTTAHKTLRGPRAGVIFSKRKYYVQGLKIDDRSVERKEIDLSKLIDKAIFPGLQGGPHANQIGGIAVTMQEAMQSSFKKYAKQVVANAGVLAKELEKLGFRLVAGGTETHLILVDLTNKRMSGGEASDKLEKNGIIVNKNTIPYDPRPPMDPSGIRLGTPALTTRGMKEKEMKQVAKLMKEVLVDNKNISAEVKKLCKKFPLGY